ncbi:sensor histidine kinase [Streptomyces vastus]|uniref:histidine kinase n=1 Tax=Streptomyces vastus TaxID=285451 RepID=A0ABN3RWX4_9ACTN
METLRNWLLPLVVAAFLLVWPGPEVLDGGYGVSREDLEFTLVVAAGTTIALGLRRRVPLMALAGVSAFYGLALLTAASDAVLMFVIVGDLVAVYSVAARTTLPVTLRAVGVLVCYQGLVGRAVDGASLSAGVGLAVAVAFHLGVVGLGRGRAHQSAARARAAASLARARAEGQEARASERRRLARELHDVSAHDLTSVVVTAEAARHLAASRPELAAEALDFAARTGRETQATVQRLVTSLGAVEEGDDVPLGTRLEELASGFIRLGQRVGITGVAGVAAAGTQVTEAVFGIAREALTNTLRYAPGAVVRVGLQDLGDGWLTLIVDDDGGSPTDLEAGAPGAGGRGLGSGRGMTGMRERAEAVGGTVTAGPGAGPSGGWSVRAELPAHPGHARPSTGRGWALDWRLASHALLPAAGILPAVFLFTEDRDAPGLLDQTADIVPYPLAQPGVVCIGSGTSAAITRRRVCTCSSTRNSSSEAGNRSYAECPPNSCSSGRRLATRPAFISPEADRRALRTGLPGGLRGLPHHARSLRHQPIPNLGTRLDHPN